MCRMQPRTDVRVPPSRTSDTPRYLRGSHSPGTGSETRTGTLSEANDFTAIPFARNGGDLSF